MKKIPFYPNSKDNTHCYQAVLKMIFGYFLPRKKFTWKELDKFTGKKKGKWTWPTKTLINFHKLGFDIKRKSTFDYGKFSKKGGRYLIEKYGKQMGNAQIRNSNIKQEMKLAKKYVEIFGSKVKLPKLSELRSLLKKGYLIIVNINYNSFYNKKGYTGHFVLIYDLDGKHVYLHDPGLPPNPNAKIPLRNFVRSWEYPDKKSRNYQAFRWNKKQSTL